MTGRVIDFDAFKREQSGEPLTIKIGGEVVTLPAELPAIVALDLARLLHDYGENKSLDANEINLIGAGLFGGQEVWHDIVARHKMTMSELSELLVAVMREYGMQADPNPVARKGQRKSTSRSSKTGT